MATKESTNRYRLDRAQFTKAVDKILDANGGGCPETVILDELEPQFDGNRLAMKRFLTEMVSWSDSYNARPAGRWIEYSTD